MILTPESTLQHQSEPLWVQAVQCQTHLLVLLEGGLELQVVPGGQDEAKSGLVCPKTTLAGLHHKQLLFGIFFVIIMIMKTSHLRYEE